MRNLRVDPSKKEHDAHAIRLHAKQNSKALSSMMSVRSGCLRTHSQQDHGNGRAAGTAHAKRQYFLVYHRCRRTLINPCLSAVTVQPRNNCRTVANWARIGANPVSAEATATLAGTAVGRLTSCLHGLIRGIHQRRKGRQQRLHPCRGGQGRSVVPSLFTAWTVVQRLWAISYEVDCTVCSSAMRRSQFALLSIPNL